MSYPELAKVALDMLGTVSVRADAQTLTTTVAVRQFLEAVAAGKLVVAPAVEKPE